MKAGILISALLLGAVAAYVVPSDLVLLLILPPLIACIILGWVITFESKAVKFRPFRLFFWPHINISAPVQQSKSLRALQAAAAFAAGSCLGILLQVKDI